MGISLRSARMSDLDRITDIRIAALYNDIWTRVIYPNGRSEKTIERSKKSWAKDVDNPSIMFTVVEDKTTSKLVAFAKWIIVERDQPNSEWDVPYEFSSAGSEANDDVYMAFDRSKHEMHLNFIKGRPHIYLSFLCTDPSEQGKGAGSLLLKQGTDIADEKSLPCYLSSTNAGHSLYLRRGFEDIDCFTLDCAVYGIPEVGRLDFMRRLPVTK